MFTPPLLSVSNGPSWAQNPETFRSSIAKQRSDWYDSFHFDNGVVIDGRSPSSAKLNAMFLPAQMSGLSVLDIGAYDGYFSFHVEQRGAAVTSNDHHVWAVDGIREQYDFLHAAVGSRAEVIDADITELGGRTWDITLFMGVLYHLEDQIAALRTVRSVTSGFTVLETVVDCLDLAGPRLAYYPGDSLNGDSTNNFGPNLDALAALVHAAGYSRWEFKNLWDWNTLSSLAGQHSVSPLTSGRVVLWLWP